MPFLLPMMLQLGFGVSAAQSGLVTFASGAGSLLMRLSAPVFIRRLGFRNVLVWVGLIAVLCLMTSAAFRPSWPMAAIYAVLLTGGFFQSLQFMAYNTIAYADVPRQQMSAATSFYATFQQLTLSLGIATSAAALATSMRIAGHAAPALSDFSAAFLFVGGIAMMAPLLSLKLDPSAGSELSGHPPVRARAVEIGARLVPPRPRTPGPPFHRIHVHLRRHRLLVRDALLENLRAVGLPGSGRCPRRIQRQTVGSA